MFVKDGRQIKGKPCLTPAPLSPTLRPVAITGRGDPRGMAPARQAGAEGTEGFLTSLPWNLAGRLGRSVAHGSLQKGRQRKTT
jgi:hypothetical protein